jgi:hypothetical protein
LKRGVGFGYRQFGVFEGFRELGVEFVERLILIFRCHGCEDRKSSEHAVLDGFET